MMRTTLKNLSARKLRLVTTSIAVIAAAWLPS